MIPFTLSIIHFVSCCWERWGG